MNSDVKAGIIPYILTESGVEMMFMIPSDPAFGGDKPQIAKGNVDPNEEIHHAAFREGCEELGMKHATFLSQLLQLGTMTVEGQYSTYDLTVYGIQVESKEGFVAPHYETKETVWLTAEQYEATGRQSQNAFVQMLAQSFDHVYPC